MDIDINSSSTWKTILKAKTIGQKFIRRIITDGENTSLWFNPWINDKLMVELLGRDRVGLSGNQDMKVKSIIHNHYLHPQLFIKIRDLESLIKEVKICHQKDNNF